MALISTGGLEPTAGTLALNKLEFLGLQTRTKALRSDAILLTAEVPAGEEQCLAALTTRVPSPGLPSRVLCGECGAHALPHTRLAGHQTAPAARASAHGWSLTFRKLTIFSQNQKFRALDETKSVRRRPLTERSACLWSWEPFPPFVDSQTARLSAAR